MTIYTELILDHYQNPRNFGRISKPTFFSKANNPLCGDEIEITVKIINEKISDIKFIAKGCAISITSASMLTDYLKGKSKSQLQKLDKEFIINMLKIDLGVNRIKCALLPLEAIKKLNLNS